MGKGASTPTRVNVDLAENAASVAAIENRTATEQINYWARIGMQVERATSAASRRILAVVTGDSQFAELDVADRTVAHATIDARMAERIAAAKFGTDARRAGQVTVAIDDDGNLIEIAPGGQRRSL